MPIIMKKTILLVLILLPGYLSAQEDSLLVTENDAPIVEYLDEPTQFTISLQKRDPALAGFLSYLIPGMGQFYNHEMEKGIGILALMGYSIYRSSTEYSNESSNVSNAVVCSGLYLFSIIDAVVSAKKINKVIALRLSKEMSMSLKPNIQLNQYPSSPVSYKPGVLLGFKLSVSL